MKKDGVPLTPLATPPEEVLADTAPEGAGRQVADKQGKVQSGLDGVVGKVCIIQGILVLEEELVHLPEPALYAGGLGRFGGPHRVRMELRQREVTKRESDVLRVALQQRAENEIGLAAVGTLKVAVLDQGDGGVRGPQDVVPRVRDRVAQAGVVGCAGQARSGHGCLRHRLSPCCASRSGL